MGDEPRRRGQNLDKREQLDRRPLEQDVGETQAIELLEVGQEVRPVLVDQLAEGEASPAWAVAVQSRTI